MKLDLTDEQASALAEILNDWYEIFSKEKDKHGNHKNRTWSDCLDVIEEILPKLKVDE